MGEEYSNRGVAHLSNLLEQLFDYKDILNILDKSRYDLRSSCVHKMWRLLHHFVMCENKIHLEVVGEAVICVKRFFFLKGYKNMTFYSLSNDISDGAQHLLFALAWIICNGGIEKCLERYMSSIFADFDRTSQFSCKTVSNLANENYEGKGFEKPISKVPKEKQGHSKEKFEKPKIECPWSHTDHYNHILLNAGRLKHLLKINRNLIEERNQLTKKVSCKTLELFGIPFFYEGNLGKLFSLIIENKCFLETKHVSNIILTYISWMEESNQFFLWVNAVIEEKEKKVGDLPHLTEIKTFSEFLLNISREKCNNSVANSPYKTKDFLAVDDMFMNNCNKSDLEAQLDSYLENLLRRIGAHVIT